jgi:hypothetical protein
MKSVFFKFTGIRPESLDINGNINDFPSNSYPDESTYNSVGSAIPIHDVLKRLSTGHIWNMVTKTSATQTAASLQPSI